MYDRWPSGLTACRCFAAGGSILHILKRLLLIVIGYVAGVLVGLASIAFIYAFLTMLPNAPAYFSAMTLSPLVILVVPPLGLILLVVVVTLTCLPALAAALLAEILSLRRSWLFALFGAAVAGGAFVYASPQTVGTIDGTDWADLAIIAAGGAVGGLAYWLIAGRKAGFVRQAPAVAV